MNLNFTFYSQNAYDFTRMELTVTSFLLTIFRMCRKHTINKLGNRWWWCYRAEKRAFQDFFRQNCFNKFRREDRAGLPRPPEWRWRWRRSLCGARSPPTGWAGRPGRKIPKNRYKSFGRNAFLTWKPTWMFYFVLRCPTQISLVVRKREETPIF